jgi:hypothetical protein
MFGVRASITAAGVDAAMIGHQFNTRKKFNVPLKALE